MRGRPGDPVIGPGGALPELAAARAFGAWDVTARLGAAAHAAGAVVVHAVAVRRPDGRGSSRNTRIFRAAGRLPVRQVAGSPAVEVAQEVAVGAGDLVVRRLHGLSPVAGTGLDAVLRNLGRTHGRRHRGCRPIWPYPSVVFDAVDLGYEAVVPADVIARVPAAYTADMVRHPLALVARVATADAVIGGWKRYGSEQGHSGQGD